MTALANPIPDGLCYLLAADNEPFTVCCDHLQPPQGCWFCLNEGRDWDSITIPPGREVAAYHLSQQEADEPTGETVQPGDPAEPSQADARALHEASQNGDQPGATAPAPATDLLAGLRSGRYLNSTAFPPLAFVVREIIPEGMTLIIGGPKIGKSWLALGIALAVASGGYALGQIHVGLSRPVLYFALEDGDRRLQERGRVLLQGEPFPESFDYFTRVQPSALIPTVRAWLDRLDHLDRPVVVLDTLGKIMPPALPGESAYGRDYRVAGGLKALCDERPGTGLLVLHHDRKAAAEDFVDSVSGTNGIAGAADTVVVLDRKRTETTGVLRVTGRDVTEGEYGVRVDYTTGWQLSGDTLQEASAAAETQRAQANLGDLMAAIVGYAAAHPEGVRAVDVAEALGALGLSLHQARTYLARLHENGRLSRPARGLYGPLGPRADVASVAYPHTHRGYESGNATTQHPHSPYREAEL